MTADGFEFDRVTTVEPVEGSIGTFRATLDPGWTIGGAPNGGVILATAARAMGRALPHPDPLTITGHFVARPASEACEIHVEVLREGRTTSTATARIVQDDQVRAHFVATFGDLSEREGETDVAGPMADIPEPDACVQQPKVPGMTPALLDHFDLRLAPACAGWLAGRTGGPLEMGGVLRFGDGREPDVWALLQFADTYPPTTFPRFGITGWVPTLELTVHVRRRPAPGWARCWFRTRALIDGMLEEDGEIRDGEGNLVAMSRQLAVMHQPKKG